MARVVDLADAVVAHPELLFDTCALIDAVNGAWPELRRVPRGARRTSVVAVWEFLHGSAGAMLSRAERRERRGWLDDQGITVVDLHPHGSRSFRSLLGVDESPPHAIDCLLAAECVARRWPFVTRNARDFVQVSGLIVVLI